MGLFEKRQAIGGGEMKEGPKPSGFGGKPFLRREELRSWLRREELWRTSKMSREERVRLERKLFDPKRFKELIEPREVERVYREIKKYPTKAREKYGFRSAGERFKALKILKELLGK